MIYNECDCDINKSFENKNIEIQGSTDIVIIQGDTNRREIIVDIDMELIEGIYFSCKDLDLNKKCIRGDKYFILEFSPSETQDLPIYTGTYDLTLKMFEGSIKTICLDETLMVLEKRNKVDYNADDNTQEIVVVLNLPEQTIIPDKNKTVTKITIPNSLLENKEVSSSFEEQVITKGTEYYGLNEVKIKPIETEAKEVELDFSTSDIQRVVNTKDKAMTEVAINKPVTLVSDNIKKGINIGGIDGSYEIKLQSKEITITQNGESEILPDEGYSGLSKVGITVNAGEPEKGVIFSDYDENGYPHTATIKGFTEIPQYYFSGIFSVSTTGVGNKIFEKIKNIVIPQDITKIQQSAFSSCTSLETINILNLEMSLSERTFDGCLQLKSINLPNLTSIPKYLLQSCRELRSVEIPNSVTSIGTSAFQGCSNLTSIEIPNSVTSLEDNAFTDCGSLTSIVIPDSVTSIGKAILSRCRKLTQAILPSSITSITTYMFSSCYKLVDIYLSNNITTIGDGAFNECQELTNLTIPTSVNSIGASALRLGSSTNKATITFKGTTPPTIGTTTFNVSYLNKIYVPSSAVEAYKTATNWVNFADYIEADPNE